MRKLPITKDQLASKELFEAFKVQLAKDFEQSNFPAGFAGTLEPDYARILEKITFELERNERKTDSRLMQLLYRIDISEAQLRKYLNEDKGKKHFEVIAELIIKRVLQKIVYKRYYKSNENS